MIKFSFAWLLLIFALALNVSAQGMRESAECVEEPHGYVSRCGYVALPQDYDNPAAGKVEIFYTLIESKSPQAKPDPLVYLVGGPGSSGTQLLRSSFRLYLRDFARDRDLIVIDQRGTGLSNPPLYCREVLYRIDEILQSNHAERAEVVLAILGECHRRLSGNNIRFETFHSANNARDIVNVLLSLGYEQWNLVGVSYGSRLALAIMRDHPQYLRSVILDSVYPPQADIFLDSFYSGERALQEVFAACAASATCSERYPDLGSVFYKLYHSLNREPETATYSPPQYKALEIEISGYRLYDWVFSWLYDVQFIKRIPNLIYDLHLGRLQDAVSYGVAHEALIRNNSLGMHYTVQCQEEHISSSYRDYAGLIAAHPHLSGYLDYPVEGSATLARLCEMWGAKARPDSANSPVKSDVPALLLSGEFDPITPPSYADMAHETLSVSYNYLLPHVGHGVLRSERCAVAIALDFLDNPDRDPDSSCIADTPSIDFE
ncbi:MAG: alpha/beta hydrolase [Chloroflexota bacterium]|nr:alpha/beta hydrolase [Chloroflexota bacterium]